MYHYTAHGLLLTLLCGLFFLTQTLVHAAAMPQSSPVTDNNLFPPPGITCAATYTPGPLITDCEKALEEVKPGQPEICTDIFLTQDDIVTVGTCTVHTYSQRGRAQCLNGTEIRNGIWRILRSCSNTQGSFTWTPEGQERDGVKLIRK